MAVSFYQTNTWREVIVILDVITWSVSSYDEVPKQGPKINDLNGIPSGWLIRQKKKQMVILWIAELL
jgi:hypothetical protein